MSSPDASHAGSPGTAQAGIEGVAPWPKRPRRLATAVIDDLVDRVVSGDFEPGGSLPAEPALCATYGVSRIVVREAIKSLEAMRLLVAQQGQKTRVRELEQWDLLNPIVLAAMVRHDAELSILDDLTDVRRALEAQMASQAAVHATAVDLTDIAQAMRALEATTNDPPRYLQADLDFHDRIMAASRNRLGRAAIRTVNGQAFRSLRYVGDPTSTECELSNEAHQAVLNRLLERDAAGAGRAMNDHIVSSWNRRRPTHEQVAADFVAAVSTT